MTALIEVDSDAIAEEVARTQQRAAPRAVPGQDSAKPGKESGVVWELCA